jgi:hypothetical protein
VQTANQRYINGEVVRVAPLLALTVIEPGREVRPTMFEIPGEAIEKVAEEIRRRTSRDYKIPVLGTPDNLETPQVFEILPFDKIDTLESRFYAVDGSHNHHTFYNGLTVALYRAGYVCFHKGQQVNLSGSQDPLSMGVVHQGSTMLLLSPAHAEQMYDELLSLPPVADLLALFGKPPGEVFGYGREQITSSVSSLLSFAQHVLEWACVYEIVRRSDCASGDYILVDGTLRSLHIKQQFLTKLGYLLHDKGVRILGVTKQSPIKTELSYTFTKIDNYLQDKLRPQYPFSEADPRRQKLCCYFEVRDDVLESAYSGTGSGMFIKKDIQGGRGFGLFFAARLDYVEKLQNYDWIICDLNIYDCVPDIAHGDLERDGATAAPIFRHLTSLSQEHYILGYPYPLVEAHNFVTLKNEFHDQAVRLLKHALYSTQQMDHTDIENLFLDIHQRF